MNAVRAKLAESPEDYAYSSAKYYIKGLNDDIITEDPYYKSFGNTIEERQQKYLEFLLDEDPQSDELFRSASIIGNNVSIGTNSTILPVRICDNTVIGAGAVVTKDINEPGIYAGNPARKIRSL